MLAHQVVPIEVGRLRAALAAHVTWFGDGAGRFVTETEEGLALHAELDAVRPAALVFRCRWPRRLSVDHQARLRDVLDAANRTSDGVKLALSIDDRGRLAVVAEISHWLQAGVSDRQLTLLLEAALARLPRVIAHLDAAFPDPFGASA